MLKPYQSEEKISVPDTLALADPELKKKLVGRRPIKNLYATYQELDPESDVAESLIEEINSQLPEEARKMLEREKDDEHKGMMMEKMSGMADSMEKICEMMEEKEEHIEMMMPDSMMISNWDEMPKAKEIKVSNLKEIKIPEVKVPEFPKEIRISNFPEVPEFPSEISVSNFPEVKPTDLNPVLSEMKIQGRTLAEAIAQIPEDLKDSSKPVKVQILDKKGNVVSNFAPNVTAVGGSGGGGYSGIKDGNIFTPDSDYDLPIGGLYEASPTSLTSGDQGVVGLSVKRAMRTTLELADGTPVTTFGGHEYQEDQGHTTGDYGIQSLGVRQDTAAALGANGDYTPFTTNARAATWVAIEDGAGGQITSFGGGVEYTEGDTDASITGKAILWEDTGDTLRAVSAAKPLPVDVKNTTIAVTQSGTWDEVGINDSGNSITVDNGGTFVVQENGAALTSLQLIDDTVFTDDTSTHTTGTTKVIGQGLVATPTDAAVNANDIGMPGMTLDRKAWVAVMDALPAGTNAIGKLAANSGVDIGDVDVTSIVPGTGATNLGKAEDAGHTTGDTGVMALGVANTADANISGTTLDYTPIATDLTGAVHVMGKVAADAAAPANPLLVGVRARNSVPTAVSAAEDLTNLWALLTGALVVSNPIGTGTTGTLDLTSASTAYRITTTSTIVHNFKVRAPEQNTGVVTWGYSSTFANNYMRILAGEPEPFGTVDLSTIYFGSSSAGDDIVYSYTS